jgi:hypothetical protein
MFRGSPWKEELEPIERKHVILLVVKRLSRMLLREDHLAQVSFRIGEGQQTLSSGYLSFLGANGLGTWFF